MPKDSGTVVDSPQTLMDPSGKEFQEMLSAAKTAAVEKLASKDDTSMVEDKGVKDKSVSPADKTVEKVDTETNEVDKEVDKDVDEIPGDDIGNLKNKVSGLQAELSRVRKQKSGSAEEAQGLKERIADMEGQLKVLRESKVSTTLEDKLAKLDDKQVISNRRMWEDELTDARVEARMAVRDNDPEAVKQANKRIADANVMLEKYDDERERRMAARDKGKSAEENERTAIAKDLDTLFQGIADVAPDIFTKDTEIWKAGQAEYSKLPALMKQLGPMGEVVAAAAAIAKHPELVGKKVADKAVNSMIDNIEKAADKAFNKGGTAPTQGNKPFTTTINNQTDLLSFEEQVRKVKGG